MSRGLYVHFPFCVRKCAYCDFYSLSGRSDLIEAYLEALLTEAGGYGRRRFTTLFIGGGTPSLLGSDGLRKVITGLSKIYSLSGLAEATIEANPDSINRDFLHSALVSGIDRISIGVQSLSDLELQKVGRIHTAAEALSKIELAAAAGFKNISADIILGLPGQDWQSLMITLETLIGMDLKHISMYCLALEPHTPLALAPPPDLPSDDEQSSLYARAVDLLQRRGFSHYEISNFALPGYACLHNLNYWRGGEYIGLGPSAASHYRGQRYKNRADLEVYLNSPAGVREETEKLAKAAKAAEEAMLRLRLLEEGLDLNCLVEKYGDRNVVALAARLNKLSVKGYLRRNGPVYRLKPSLALVSNSILAELLD
ncbi:MAG TPA: radical SAM family heme chaperone HemW [Dehalococcoidales bacterium]|nr:radical SAM family heme chaperone HemW [Dehalococcoidales bacterium]